MKNRVLIRGGGDLASAIVQKLHRSGFEVIVRELEQPKVVRRFVSFANAMYEKEMEVEGLHSKRADSIEEIQSLFEQKVIPVTNLPEDELIKSFDVDVFVDASLSKREPDYNRTKANTVIALGPEREAGVHADVVIETNRGHDLGRLLFSGTAQPNTHEPGSILGMSKQRVLRAPTDGFLKTSYQIGDIVQKGERLGAINDQDIFASIDGVLRGWIHPSVRLHRGMKIGDIDPRSERSYCFSISDKARNIAGAVLEAILISSQ